MSTHLSTKVNQRVNEPVLLTTVFANRLNHVLDILNRKSQQRLISLLRTWSLSTWTLTPPMLPFLNEASMSSTGLKRLPLARQEFKHLSSILPCFLSSLSTSHLIFQNTTSAANAPSETISANTWMNRFTAASLGALLLTVQVTVLINAKLLLSWLLSCFYEEGQGFCESTATHWDAAAWLFKRLKHI